MKVSVILNEVKDLVGCAEILRSRSG